MYYASKPCGSHVPLFFSFVCIIMFVPGGANGAVLKSNFRAYIPIVLDFVLKSKAGLRLFVLVE